MTFRGPIGELIEFSIGGGWGLAEQKTGHSEVAVIRGTDIPKVAMGDFSTVPRRFESDKKLANRLLVVGDVVLETAGGSSANGQFTGRTLLITEEILSSLGPTICASFCKRLSLNTDVIEPGFFYWHMQDLYSSGRVAIYDSQSTGISNFQFSSFLDSEMLELPDLPAQTAIANSLSNLNELINLNIKVSKSLDDLAQSIFKSWFVDFDPVKAKIAGEKPVGLDDATAALFPDSMGDSELGPIPKGWEVSSLREIASISKSSINPQNHPEVEFKHYSIPDFDKKHYPSTATGREILSSKYLLTASAVLLSKLNPETKRIWTVVKPAISSICSTEFIVLVPKNESLLPFLNSLIRNPSFYERFVSLATGSTGSRQRVRPEDIQGIAVFFPSYKLLEKFAELVGPCLEQQDVLSEEIQTLLKVRDSLLPRLISGELQIPEEMLVS
jgi:type I restriction enzyme S subunit